MEFIVGITLALGLGSFASITGLDRDRAFYPAALIVIASYYDLFAVLGGGSALVSETAVFTIFLLIALIGFRTNLWIVVYGLIGHGLLDLTHGHLVADEGVPEWWPAFCLGFDLSAGVYLAWKLGSDEIAAHDDLGFRNRIPPFIRTELDAAKTAESDGNFKESFRRLERAHILSQSSTIHHVVVHLRMLMWSIRRRDLNEMIGQLLRIVGAASKTWLGLVPLGNTGGSNVGIFKPMPIPEDLANILAAAHSRTES